MKPATEVIFVLHEGAFTDLFMVVPIHINYEEEADVGSDEEEFVLEHGNFQDGIFSYGDVLINPDVMAVDYSSISGIEVTGCSRLQKYNIDFP